MDMNDELHLKEFETYLRAGERSALTIAGYLGDVLLFTRWYQEENKEPLTPAGLSAEAVRGYKQHLLELARKPKTVNRRLASLAAYAHWLEQEGLITGRNPVQGIKAVREAPLAPRWLERKQRALLLRAADRLVEEAMRRYPRLRLMVVRDAAILRLLLFAGLRAGEVVRLHMDDLLLDERRGSLVIRQGKGGKRRTVPLNAQARKGLAAYLSLRPEGEALFLGQRGEAVQVKTVQRAVTRFARAAGLKNVTPHTLRHTFAKTLIDNGVGLEKVAALLGHESLNTTRIYTTPGMQDLEQAVEGMERF
jgi:integrase/recombinase XerC